MAWAGIATWRFFTPFPAAILMPDRLWLHPSFGMQRIPFSNITGMRLGRLHQGRNRQIGLVIELEEAAKRNWLFLARISSRYEITIREISIDGSLYNLGRFRNRLAVKAALARQTLHPQ